MFTVGLTGGIGSGKSTLAALLAERGAQVVDADQIARDALRPGQPAWHSVVDSFGEDILAAGSMDIDRKRLARLVFSDPNKLAALNAITHPVITGRIADSLERLSSSDAIVVVDAALIVDLGLDSAMDALIVVHASDDERRRRLQVSRGMARSDVNARISAQASPAELLERADIVVRNDGSLDDLSRDADRVWERLREMASG